VKKILTFSVEMVESNAENKAEVAESANIARILANEPSNVMTPAALAKAALEATRGIGVRCTVRDEHWLRRKKMNAILAVAQGSENPPRLVMLEYNPAGAKGAPIALVGKGVSFDSGGISIKPSNGMEKMKYDMSGGAAVIAAVQALAKLEIRQRVVGIVPFVENMPSGSAQRPGDVIKTYSGKYVEVLNTDAEGRLILADALAYAQEFKPQAIIDLATLTGACVVALGHEAIGMMGTDDALKARLKEAGEKTGERVWELPLWQEYFEAIKSDVADIKNVGARGAGTITAAMFLKEFVGNYPWVHLDIAGTAWVEKTSHPYLNPGPSGVGVRLLVEAIRNW
jgi:leucyl aminopeptidase